MKNKNSGICRHSWLHKKIKRKARNGVAFEAFHPRFRPPVLLSDRIRQVCLGGSKVGQCPVHFGVKFINHILHRIGSPPEHGRIPNIRPPLEYQMPLNPVMNDAPLSGHVIEKAINVAQNEKIQVQEQTVSHEVLLIVSKKTQLEPSCSGVAFRKIDARQWPSFDVRQKPRRVVGQTKKSKRSVQVRSYGSV